MAFEWVLRGLDDIHNKLKEIKAQADLTRDVQQQVTASAAHREIDSTEKLVNRVIAELNLQAKRSGS